MTTKWILTLFLSFISFNAFATNHVGMQFGTGTFNQVLSGQDFAGASVESKTRFNGRLYLLSDMNLKSPIAAEFGFTAGDQQHTLTQAGNSATYTRPRFTFDFLGRLHLPFISVGAGAFWGFTPWEITHETSTSTRIVYANHAGFGSSDFGFVASARLTIPMGPFGLTFDVRHLWGTYDHVNTETAEARSRELQILAGFEFN